MRLALSTVALSVLALAAAGQDKPWMDIQDCPLKHPGPWLTLCPRWRPDGKAILVVQGARDTRLQEIDLAEKPNEHGWLDGKTIGLATPADRHMHAFPAYGPGSRYVAFSLSPLHFTVRDQIAPLGYKPWKDGNQMVWQELCVGRAVAGKDNVWIPLTEGGHANRDADWYLPR